MAKEFRHVEIKNTIYKLGLVSSLRKKTPNINSLKKTKVYFLFHAKVGVSAPRV